MAISEPNLVDLASVPAVAVRLVGDMDLLDVGALFGEYSGVVMGNAPAPTAPIYARYWAFGPDRYDIEIGIPCPTDLPPLAIGGAPGSTTLPAGRAATATLTGHYQGLGGVYDRLVAFTDANGLERADGPWESYDDDPGSVPVDETRTTVFWPLADA